MARYSDKKIPYRKQDALWDEFCRTISSMRRREDVKRFLKDLLNRQERLMLVRRLQVADLLDRGATYEEIQRQLRVGKSTIARIQRWLNFGRNGYKRALIHLRKK